MCFRFCETAIITEMKTLFKEGNFIPVKVH